MKENKTYSKSLKNAYEMTKNKFIPSYIIVKLQKVKDNKKILHAAEK